MGENQNGWNEYSRLVLTELEKLNNSVNEISDDMADLRQEITKIKSIKYDIIDIKEWRKDLSEVVSPTQLKEVKKDIDKLKTFKTISTTVWLVVQIIFGIALALFGVFKNF
jgi:ribosomal protein L29|tara:strand:+ start:47 stop:379 length:333 start_codon:yes stop_codon:yes gene_type:complete